MLARVWLIAVLLPSFAMAQGSAEDELRAIRELTMRARFDEAITAAQQLAQRTDLDAADRNAALEALAVAQIATRHSADADRTLGLLYSRDPNHRLTDPDASPPVLSAFARARESRPRLVDVQLDHTPPTLTRREPPEIVVRVRNGADAVQEIRLMYRMGDEGEARVVMTRRNDGSYVARIPVIGDSSRTTDVAYHIVALAPSFAALGGAGSAAEPLQIRIPAESARVDPVVVGPREIIERPPHAGPTEPVTPPPHGGTVFEEWWFWTLIVVVVGAAVTTAIVLGPMQDGPQTGSLGSARLMSIEMP